MQSAWDPGGRASGRRNIGFPPPPNTYTWWEWQPANSTYKSTYNYHKHGLLRRHEMGYLKQGLDYVYTIQGWLKAINHSSDNSAYDPSQDGANGSVPQDVFGMILNYYDGDFNKPASPYYSDPSNTLYLGVTNPLYNGNISSWQQHIYPTGTPGLKNEEEVGNKYVYDQLNRLAVSTFYYNKKPDFMATNTYGEEFSYDRNGNILGLKRNADLGSSVGIDDFGYTYTAGTNQLDNVVDNSGWGNFNMWGTQYQYDAVGNAISDGAQNLTMTWTPANKLWSTSSPTMNISYLYYGDGNLARKCMDGDIPNPHEEGTIKTQRCEYYIRDASGNLLALYEEDNAQSIPFDISERYIYGTEMLAVIKGPNIGESLDMLPGLDYLIKDHLGNVRVTLGEDNTSYPANLDIKTYSNTYAFGAPHPYRTYNQLDQRHAFNGVEKADELKGVGLHYSFKAREFDPVYGRFWSGDPYRFCFPSESAYSFAGNSPILFVDAEGKYKLVGSKDVPNPREKYKTLAQYLDNGVNELLMSDLLMTTYERYGISRDEIKAVFKRDGGPRIEIVKEIHGRSSEFAHGWTTSDGKTIQITEAIVKDLQDADKATRQAALLVVMSTLLHENVHSVLNSQGKGDPFGNGEGDKGNELINTVYGNGDYFVRDIWTIKDARRVIEWKSLTREGIKDLPKAPGGDNATYKPTGDESNTNGENATWQRSDDGTILINPKK